MSKSAAKPAKLTAAEQLQAFELEKFGPDHVRFEGRPERGIGSLWSRLSDKDKTLHAELEKAAEAEANA